MNVTTLLNELALISPMLTLGLGALAIMLLEVFLPSRWPRAQFTALVLILAILMLDVQGGMDKAILLFGGLVYHDSFVVFLHFIVLLGSLLALMMGVHNIQREGVEAPGEYYSLYLLASAGAMLFVSSAELITLFVALETMSMALYCLCGSAISVKRSVESALKYFLLGSFSSAFMLYGIALLYGITGSTSIPAIVEGLQGANQSMLFASLGLLIVGIVFKIGGVPFHFWAPDVYEGAPTTVTAYMSCVVKAVSVAVAVRILWTMYGTNIVFWSTAIWYVAAFTMIVGNVVAVTQRSVKRMLAYSSIAHAGYMLVGLLAPGDRFGGGAAILYYLAAYTVMTMGAFAVLATVAGDSPSDTEPRAAEDIGRFNGLASRRPVVAALMTLFLLSLAGLPPGMAGLLGKVYIFSSAVKADYVGLTIIGVLSSAVSVYYYLRVVVAMYFMDAGEQQPKSQPIGIPMGGVLALCAVAVVVLGVFPSGLYDGAVVVIQSSKLLP